MPEHIIFLITAPGSTIDTWEGRRYPERKWQIDDVGYLPAGSGLTSKITATTYDEVLIRLRDDYFRRFAEGAADFSGVDLRYQAVEDRSLAMVCRAIKVLMTRPDPPCILLVESLMVSLGASITRSLYGSTRGRRVAARGKGLSVERRRRVVEYVAANAGGTITLMEMASVAALSPHHFSRAFRISFGIPPVRYVWAVRIRMAKKMLEKQSIPLSAVASACGFSSQSHFNDLFKESGGLTPLAYRRRCEI